MWLQVCPTEEKKEDENAISAPPVLCVNGSRCFRCKITRSGKG